MKSAELREKRKRRREELEVVDIYLCVCVFVCPSVCLPFLFVGGFLCV